MPNDSSEAPTSQTASANHSWTTKTPDAYELAKLFMAYYRAAWLHHEFPCGGTRKKLVNSERAIVLACLKVIDKEEEAGDGKE